MLTKKQEDCCAGVSLLYLGPDGRVNDELTPRMVKAMEQGDVDEAEHVAALMIVSMVARKENVEFAIEQFMNAFPSKGGADESSVS